MFKRQVSKAGCAMLGRILFTLALAASLAGCDRCGDWWNPFRVETQACKPDAPRPQ